MNSFHVISTDTGRIVAVCQNLDNAFRLARMCRRLSRFTEHYYRHHVWLEESPRLNMTISMKNAQQVC